MGDVRVLMETIVKTENEIKEESQEEYDTDEDLLQDDFSSSSPIIEKSEAEYDMDEDVLQEGLSSNSLMSEIEVTSTIFQKTVGFSASGHKRVRNPNFSPYERNLLIKLANKRRKILENKKTDSATNGMKVAAWLAIVKEFNAIRGPEGQPRDAKCLRSKYECIKKEIRKKLVNIVGRDRGGLPYQLPPQPVSEEETELFESILLGIEGVEPVLDGDCGYRSGVEQDNLTSDSPKTPEIGVNWQNSNTLMLQTPKPTTLSVETPFSSNLSIVALQEEEEEEEEVVTQNNVPLVPGSSIILQQPTMSMSSTSDSISEQSVRQRPIIRKKRPVNSPVSKFEKLAEKLKFVELKERMKREKEKHNQEMRNLKAEGELKRLQAEEVKLRIEIMKRNNGLLE